MLLPPSSRATSLQSARVVQEEEGKLQLGDLLIAFLARREGRQEAACIGSTSDGLGQRRNQEDQRVQEVQVTLQLPSKPTSSHLAREDEEASLQMPFKDSEVSLQLAINTISSQLEEQHFPGDVNGGPGCLPGLHGYVNGGPRGLFPAPQ